MVKKFWYLIIAVVLGLILLFIKLHQRNGLPNLPVREPGEIMTEMDRNDDGNVDTWVFTDLNNVPVRAVLDVDFDGRPDNWSHFKNGKAFLDQEDTDHDGTIDLIAINLLDEEEEYTRGILFLLEENIFVKVEDTGWLVCFPESTQSSPSNPYSHTIREGYGSAI